MHSQNAFYSKSRTTNSPENNMVVLKDPLKLRDCSTKPCDDMQYGQRARMKYPLLLKKAALTF